MSKEGQMYAMVVTVKIDAARVDESDKVLHEVTIPRAKFQAGFVRGVWLRSPDNANGRGVVLLDTEDNATALAELVRQGPPPGAPVTFESVEIFQVVGEA